jgi:RNA polymerase sigma-70 factor, ECF subfamily
MDPSSRVGMTDEAGGLPGDDLVALIVQRLEEARRIATWILHDSQAAEDAVQEAAMLAWKRRSTVRDGSALDAWFGRIVVNVCRDELRRRSRRPRITPLLAAATVPDEGAAAGGEPVRDEVAAALARLDRDDQVLLALRYGADLAVPQIAARLGLREGTVKSRLHAALQRMSAALAAERRVEEAMVWPA